MGVLVRAGGFHTDGGAGGPRVRCPAGNVDDTSALPLTCGQRIASEEAQTGWVTENKLVNSPAKRLYSK